MNRLQERRLALGLTQPQVSARLKEIEARADVGMVSRYEKGVCLPTEAQLAKVKEWLLWAVTEAEKDLGGGTGKLKLRQVYDLFVTRFPWLAKLVSFELFSDMVDEALEQMREMLDTNEAVKAFVEGE